jgi:RimJ/RimL family protein N-acetyltransferase
MTQPVLHTSSGLTLRPWANTDAEMLVTAFADVDIRQWYARSMTDAAEALTWIERWRRRWAQEAGVGFVIVDGDETVGQLNLRNLDLANGEAKFSSWVLPHARRRGVLSAATAELLRWAQEDIGLRRVERMHSTVNAPACHAAEKSGFGYEGTLRRKARFADGWHDLHLHAWLAADA